MNISTNPQADHQVGLRYFFSTFFQHRQLIWQLLVREIQGRFKGSILGSAWAVLSALIMLALYTFIFGFIFKARWSQGADNPAEFALVLYLGLVLHGVLGESVGRAPHIVMANQAYVKKVAFPLEILTWTVLGSILFQFFAGLLVWFVAYLIFLGDLSVTMLYFPIILLPLIFYSLGVTWLLSSLGVYIRDISQLTGVISMVLLFLCPIFYPISTIPLQYQKFMYLNPLTVIVEQFRNVLLWGKSPDWEPLAISFGISLMVAWLGFVWFQKTRKGFADVL